MKRFNIRQGFALLGMAMMLAASIFLWMKSRTMFSDVQALRIWLKGFGWKSRGVFVMLVVLQVIIAILPGEPLELAAGYVFGSVEGTLLTVLGVLIGSVIVTLLVHWIGLRMVRLFFEEDKVERIQRIGSSERAWLIWCLLMILPGTPKDLLTYCAGLTSYPLSKWLVLFSVGRLPSIVTSTVAGSMIGEKQYLFAAAVFAGTALLSGIGLWFYAWIERRNQEQTTDTKNPNN